jgi:archaeosine synthase beta-subunit
MPSTSELPLWDDDWVVSRRGERPAHDPWKPHGVLVEKERTRRGTVEDVATVFLVNRECPFRCVMCDLWKYTTTERVPDGAVAAQVEQALASLGPEPAGLSRRCPDRRDKPGGSCAVRHVKLYNAGNFFDAQAVPPADLPRVAELVADFDTVLVECHPKLVDRRALDFRDRLKGELQVAMGLETVHPDVLPRLNKHMTLDDFARATSFLTRHDIPVRAFLLLRPPLLDEAEGLEWAKRSLDWAFAAGVECCVIIPTRAGNGAMEDLQSHELWSPPSLDSLEAALEYGLALNKGRVFADLWDVAGEPGQLARIQRMNLEGRA